MQSRFWKASALSPTGGLGQHGGQAPAMHVSIRWRLSRGLIGSLEPAGARNSDQLKDLICKEFGLKFNNVQLYNKYGDKYPENTNLVPLRQTDEVFVHEVFTPKETAMEELNAHVAEQHEGNHTDSDYVLDTSRGLGIMDKRRKVKDVE